MYAEIKSYLKEGVVPSGDTHKKMMFVLKFGPYTLVQDILFRKGPVNRLRRCVSKESWKVMHTLHSREGGHFGGETTIKKIREAGYWWPTLHKDVHQYIRSCEPCQHSSKPSVRDLTPIIPLDPFCESPKYSYRRL
jgi:Integrase zinc binding domain